MDLSVGAGVAFMPLLLLALPGIVLFVVLPGILLLALAAPMALIGAVIGLPPYLWRRRRQRARVTRSSTRPASGMSGVRQTCRCSKGQA